MTKRIKKRKRKEGSHCKWLFIDVFGHPFCTQKPPEEAIKCEYCMASQEYRTVIAQQNSPEYKGLCEGGDEYKFPGIYRCTKLDHLADRHGHLPQRMRPKLKKGLHGITVNFD